MCDSRTVKVTGFSLQTSIKSKLADLFSRVAQVQKVSLSPDKNAAFVRFYHKASTQFAIEHDWELGREQLRVRDLFSSSSNDQPTVKYVQDISTSEPPNIQTHWFSKYEYKRGRSKFWEEVPHHTFTVVGKRPKRQKCSSSVQCCPSQGRPKTKHRTKKRKGKRRAYLEQTRSISFGTETPKCGDFEITNTVESIEPVTSGYSVPKDDTITLLKPQERLWNEPQYDLKPEVDSPKCNPGTNGRKEIFAKGKNTIVLSFDESPTADILMAELEVKTKTPRNLLHVTAGGKALNSDVARQLQHGATLLYNVKGKGGMQSPQEDSDVYVTQDSDDDQVRTWLLQKCGLSKDQANDFEHMNGETLFSFQNWQELQVVASTDYCFARKCFYLRDHQDENSVMLRWSCEEVISFIQGAVKGKVSLDSLLELKVDGVVFRALDDAKEMEEHLGIKGMLAKRILVEKNKFLKEEQQRIDAAQERNTAVCNPESQVGSPKPSDVDTTLRLTVSTSDSATKQEANSTHKENEKQSQSPVSECPEIPVVYELPSDDKFREYKLFLQDRLRLQHLHAHSIQVNSNTLVRCDCKVIYHKIKDWNSLNGLEKNFLFLVMGRQGFWMGKNVNKRNKQLWNVIIRNKQIMQLSELHEKLRFEKQPVRVCPLTTYNETIFPLTNFKYVILVIDKTLLKDECEGYFFQIGTKQQAETFYFGFKKCKYWIFDSDDLEKDLQNDRILEHQRGKSRRWRLTVPREPEFPLEIPQTIGESTTPSSSSQEIIEKADCSPVEDGVGDVDAKDNITKDAPGIQFSSPRPFGQQRWTYQGGTVLQTIESGDGLLSRSTEFKYQCRCQPETSDAKRSFLYKALEFACGCLNSRQNGTIYFGIAEKPDGPKQYEYGSIVGIPMNQKLVSEYYDLFRKCIEDCFATEQLEIAKRCVCGPHFVLVQNGSGLTYVIEIDIEPASTQCKNEVFTFDPNSVFEDFGQPKQKHVFSKNRKKWTGLFRRDGSATCYVNENARKDFLRDILPPLVSQRQEQEKRENELNRRMLSSPEAEKLKTFISDIDIFPILVLPKLSDHDKQTNMDHFRFLHYIHWCAVFDFDNRSHVDGVCAMSRTNNKMETGVHEVIISDFEDAQKQDFPEKICFLQKAAWIFANGKDGEQAFDRLDHELWKEKHLTYVISAVHAFYKNKEIIPAGRRRALILIAEEFKDGIVELSDQLKIAFGWENLFFIFTSTHVRDHISKELQLGEKILTRSVVMPWKHSHNVICECLNVKGRNRDKLVSTAKGARVPIPVAHWQSWGNLEILGINECEEEWQGMSKEQRKQKAHEEELNFYKGHSVSWYNFFCTDIYNHVMKRTVMTGIIDEIRRRASHTENDIAKELMVSVVYFPGAGGTTLGKSILWELKQEYKCAVISMITEKTAQQICQFWEAEEELQAGCNTRKELKPVILFADNLSTEHPVDNIHNLSKQLFLKQIEYRLSKPVAVIIHCRRFEDPFHGGHKQLTQTLTPVEKEWIEQKHEQLEHEQPEEVETLIAFLSLRHQFDKTKLKDTVLRYVQHTLLQKNERILVEYIALIASYIPASDGVQGLPVAACDDLMRTIQPKTYLLRETPWEKNLSIIAKILLVIEKQNMRDRTTYIVRIAHQQYAKVILESVLDENNESLADITIGCLKSALVTSTSHSAQTVHWILRNLLIRRHVDEETGEMTQLSPLIMDIYRECSFERAADVFREAFEKLRDSGFHQQLARLYLKEKQFDRALEYALHAVTMAPDSKEFKHTLGLVYARKFCSVKDRTHFNNNPHEQTKNLEIAFNALQNFMSSRGREDSDMIHNCFTAGQIIQTINDILSFLEIISPKEELHKIGRYLTQTGYRHDLFDTHPGFPEMLKTLIDKGVQEMKFLFYICYSYQSIFQFQEISTRKYRYKRTVSFVKRYCQNFKTFTTLLKRIHDPLWGNTTEVREDNAYRVENIKLHGCFFESILQNLHGAATKTKRFKENVLKLKQIKHNLEQISELSDTDKDNLMSVCLALELAKQDAPFSQNYSIFYKMCCCIIRAQRETDKLCFLRAHLYRVLLSWFNKDKPGFVEDEFRSSFQLKSSSLGLPARVHFFVTRANPSLQLCHWTEVYEHEDDDENNRLTEIVTKRPDMLKVFTGMHKIKVTEGKSQYSYIDMELQYQTSFNLKINKIRGVAVTRECPVEFYLGFSLHGPVAYVRNELDLPGQLESE